LGQPGEPAARCKSTARRDGPCAAR
ncbi:hypothetical protein, partial [Escherichia coli]